MANDYEGSGLMRDPATGRMLSKLASTGKRAEYAARTVGVSDTNIHSQELEAESESPLVKNYVLELIKFVREFDGPPVRLREVIPIIQEFVQLSVADKNLSEAEHRRVTEKGNELVGYIQQRTSVMTRLRTKLKGIAKATEGTRENVADRLSETSSLVGKLGGRLLRPRKEKEGGTEFQKGLAETRSGIYKELLDGVVASKPAKVRKFVPGLGKSEDFDDEPPTEEAKPKKAKRVRKKKVDDTVASEGTLDSILTVNQAVLKQLEIQTNLLRTNNEFGEQLKEEGERNRDAGQTAPIKVTTAVTAQTKATTAKTGGLIDSLFGNVRSAFKTGLELFFAKQGFAMFGSVFGQAASMLGGVLKTGIGALAKGAAVYGGVKAVGALTGQESISDMAGYAGAGATIGSVVPGVGTVAGATIGAGVGGYKQVYDQRAGVTDMLMHPLQTAQDVYDSVSGKSQDQMARERQPKSPERPVANAVTKAALPSRSLSPNYAPNSPMRDSRGTASPDEMHLSDAGLDRLAKREGFRKEPYWDVTGWAIGYGDHNFMGVPLGNDKDHKPNISMSDAQARAMLRERVRSHFEPIIKRQLTNPVSQNQFDALVSVAYNSEAAASKLARRLNAGEKLHAKDFLASGTVQGRKTEPLQRRRADEFAQFVTGPTPGRSALPIVEMTAATNTQHGSGGVVVVAPVTQIAQGGGAQMPMIVQPLSADNPNDRLKAIKSVSGI